MLSPARGFVKVHPHPLRHGRWCTQNKLNLLGRTLIYEVCGNHDNLLSTVDGNTTKESTKSLPLDLLHLHHSCWDTRICTFLNIGMCNLCCLALLLRYANLVKLVTSYIVQDLFSPNIIIETWVVYLQVVRENVAA
uniref:Uncharacterized protein n=1 Tax=Tanacetum cinerariifolium TaxID=118510 RepID=A0A699HD34_TANCI|nr:hypothetical protein [Tanacetum cinerariifolium]